MDFDDALTALDDLAQANSRYIPVVGCVAEYITQLEKRLSEKDIADCRKAAEDYANSEEEDGDECQSCHNGTLEVVGDEVRCRGECGAVMKMTEVSDASNALPVYEVIVGNMGTVCRGLNRNDALNEYDVYVDHSINNFGRAAGEPVTLMEDGEPIREYAGTLE